MLNGKGTIILLTVGLIKKMMNSLKMLKNINTTDTSDLVKKAKKIKEMIKKITDHNQSKKYVTTQEFNSLMADNFAGRLKQASFACKFGITNFLKKIYF